MPSGSLIPAFRHFGTSTHPRPTHVFVAAGAGVRATLSLFPEYSSGAGKTEPTAIPASKTGTTSGSDTVLCSRASTGNGPMSRHPPIRRHSCIPSEPEAGGRMFALPASLGNATSPNHGPKSGSAQVPLPITGFAAFAPGR